MAEFIYLKKKKKKKLTLEDGAVEMLELGDALTVMSSVRHTEGRASGSFFSPRTSRAGGDEALRSLPLFDAFTV